MEALISIANRLSGIGYDYMTMAEKDICRVLEIAGYGFFDADNIFRHGRNPNH
jgi:hypothetical protein